MTAPSDKTGSRGAARKRKSRRRAGLGACPTRRPRRKYGGARNLARRSWPPRGGAEWGRPLEKGLGLGSTPAQASASPATRRSRHAQRPSRRRAASPSGLGAPSRPPASGKSARSRAGSGEEPPPTDCTAKGHRRSLQEPGAPRGGHSRRSGNYRTRRTSAARQRRREAALELADTCAGA